jgi:HD-like signal output (HDOD) protein
MVIPLALPRKSGRNLCNLPVFDSLRPRISEAFLSRPDPQRLAGIVALDPAIAAELLMAANAPAYGRPSQVYTTAQAIHLLGWNETERIANLAYDSQAKFKPDLQILIRAHWAHSLACAVAASRLARFAGMPEERAFAFGMFHDIGIWGLMSASPEAYARVVSQGSGSCLEKMGAEQCVLGLDHCQAGSWLAKSWGLPPEFAEAAATHHEIEIDGGKSVAMIVAMACRWADALGFSVGHSERITVRDAVRIAPPTLRPNLKAASEEIGQSCRARLREYARDFERDTAEVFARL